MKAMTQATQTAAEPRSTIHWSGEIGASHRDCCAFRDDLAGALEAHDWAEQDAFRVLVCASEALANAVEHGSHGSDSVHVRCTVSATHATLVVTDRGPNSAPAPAVGVPDEASEHGRGVLLMHALADSLRIRTRATGTLVALAFRAG